MVTIPPISTKKIKNINFDSKTIIIHKCIKPFSNQILTKNEKINKYIKINVDIKLLDINHIFYCRAFQGLKNM
jgi:hypothetical protein